MKNERDSRRQKILLAFLASQLLLAALAARSFSLAEGLDSIIYLVVYGVLFILSIVVLLLFLVFGRRTEETAVYERPSSDIILFFVLLLAILSLPGLYLMLLLFG